MPERRPAKTRRPSASAKTAAAAPAPAAPSAAGSLAAAGLAPVMRVARDLRAWTDTVLGVAGGATDMSLALAKGRFTDPKARAAIEAAGSMIRRAREAAGVTTRELGAAIDLSDPDLLERAERGKVALPFEVVLRLAAVLGRNDPVTFALKLTRSYSPELWKVFEDLGVGSLVLQAGRERELANLYRANDAARKLSDADFAEVLRFTAAAFEMAVAFRSPAKPRKAAGTAT